MTLAPGRKVKGDRLGTLRQLICSAHLLGDLRLRPTHRSHDVRHFLRHRLPFLQPVEDIPVLGIEQQTECIDPGCVQLGKQSLDERFEQEFEFEHPTPAAPAEPIAVFDQWIRRLQWCGTCHSSTVNRLAVRCIDAIHCGTVLLADIWQTLTPKPVAERPPTAPGALHLADLRTLLFEGADVIGFLQGYLTCDVDELSGDRWQPAALCNIKGRVVAFGWARRRSSEQILWVVHESTVEIITAALRPYLAFSKTRLSLYAPDHLLIGLTGPDIPHQARLQSAPSDATGAGIELIETAADLEPIAADSSRIDHDDWIRTLIELRIAWLTAPVSGRFLPQMLAITELGAVNFDKGCYLGQEIVARAQHLGKVKRTLSPMRWSGTEPPTAGGDIRDARGREVGTLIQTTKAAQGVRSCLAVLQAEATAPFREGATDLELDAGLSATV